MCGSYCGISLFFVPHLKNEKNHQRMVDGQGRRRRILFSSRYTCELLRGSRIKVQTTVLGFAFRRRRHLYREDCRVMCSCKKLSVVLQFRKAQDLFEAAVDEQGHVHSAEGAILRGTNISRGRRQLLMRRSEQSSLPISPLGWMFKQSFLSILQWKPKDWRLEQSNRAGPTLQLSL